MANYLWQHYKGKYRILPEYDTERLDFPRDEKGNIDPDFNDFYIKCRPKVQIKHAGGNNLGCWIFSTGVANNILKDIYKKETGKEESNNTRCENKLIKLGLISDVTHYDGEMLFTFKADKLDDWATIFKCKTSGANISPTSTKNLPSADYSIPKEDEADYKAVFPKDMKPIEKAQIVKKVAAEMVAKLTKKQRADMKRLNMKTNQYIHSIGKWNKYLDMLKEEIDNGGEKNV